MNLSIITPYCTMRAAGNMTVAVTVSVKPVQNKLIRKSTQNQATKPMVEFAQYVAMIMVSSYTQLIVAFHYLYYTE